MLWFLLQVFCDLKDIDFVTCRALQWELWSVVLVVGLSSSTRYRWTWCLIKKIIWVFFQTAILNPNNISTEGLYFEDPDLLGSHFSLLCFIKCKTLFISLVKIIFAARVPSLLVFLASLYLTLQMVNNPKTVFNWFWFCFSSTFTFQLMRSQVACFMVTEPSIDEELVPKSEDVNGNQEILMDQVLSKSSFLLPSL